MSFLEETSFNLNKPLPGKIKDYDLVLSTRRKRPPPAFIQLRDSAKQQKIDGSGADHVTKVPGGLPAGAKDTARERKKRDEPQIFLHEEIWKFNLPQSTVTTKQGNKRRQPKENKDESLEGASAPNDS